MQVMEEIDWKSDGEISGLMNLIQPMDENWESHLDDFNLVQDKCLDTFDIYNLTSEILEGLENQTKAKGIVASIQIESPIFICSDRAKLRKVLRHLIRNAIVYNSFNGKLRIYLMSFQDSCLIRIEDEGSGVPFESSDNLDIDHMGMSLCKDWIRDLGGTLTILKGKISGTEVQISLPTRNNLDDKITL